MIIDPCNFCMTRGCAICGYKGFNETPSPVIKREPDPPKRMPASESGSNRTASKSNSGRSRNDDSSSKRRSPSRRGRLPKILRFGGRFLGPVGLGLSILFTLASEDEKEQELATEKAQEQIVEAHEELYFYFQEDFEEKYGKFEEIGMGMRYAGPMLRDRPHGKGCLLLETGAYFAGDFVHGQFTGEGEAHYSNGDAIHGSFENGQPVGEITYYYNNGNRFEGRVIEGNRWHGTMYYNNNQIYEGDIVDHQREGEGTLFHDPLKKSYTKGEWWNDKSHGYTEELYFHSVYGVVKFEGNKKLGKWKGRVREYGGAKEYLYSESTFDIETGYPTLVKYNGPYNYTYIERYFDEYGKCYSTDYDIVFVDEELYAKNKTLRDKWEEEMGQLESIENKDLKYKGAKKGGDKYSGPVDQFGEPYAVGYKEKGVMTLTTGVRLEGNFIYGKFFQGKMLTRRGRGYEGKFNDQIIYGMGTYHGYLGEFSFNTAFSEDGRSTGLGKIEFKDGSVYEGEVSVLYIRYNGWINILTMHGRGTLKSTEGWVYSGEFQHNKRHGLGTMHYKENVVGFGQWHRDKEINFHDVINTEDETTFILYFGNGESGMTVVEEISCLPELPYSEMHFEYPAI